MDLGQVFTGEAVANYMMAMFGLKNDALILDPCFGAGAFLEAAQQRGFTNIEGYEIDKELYTKVKERFPAFRLYNSDFLKVSGREKYDGIIMNPPYIRQEKIDDLKAIGITKSKLRKNKIYEHLPNTANLYMYFILKALDLLKQNGELIVIFPSSWMTAKSGSGFQYALNANAAVVRQVHITGEVFEKSALVDVIILKLKKGKERENCKIEYLEMKNNHIYKIQRRSEYNEVKFDVPFVQYATVRRGLTTGHNAMYINPDFESKESELHLVPIISSPKSISGYRTKGAKTDLLLSVREEKGIPEEILSYVKRWEREIQNRKTPKTLYQKIKKSKGWYKINPIDSKGIVFGYIVRNDMKFVMNDGNCFVRDNFYIIKPQIDRYLMQALLNNYYTYYQLEKSGKKYGAGLLKLQRYDIEALKFPDINTFSDYDRKRLAECARDLTDKGNAENLQKITEILSNYSKESYEKITDMYKRIKKDRLEGNR